MSETEPCVFHLNLEIWSRAVRTKDIQTHEVFSKHSTSTEQTGAPLSCKKQIRADYLQGCELQRPNGLVSGKGQ